MPADAVPGSTIPEDTEAEILLQDGTWAGRRSPVSGRTATVAGAWGSAGTPARPWAAGRAGTSMTPGDPPPEVAMPGQHPVLVPPAIARLLREQAAVAAVQLLDSSEPAARIDSVTGGIHAVFEQASCEGMLCVQSLDGHAEVDLRADVPVVPASVVKVQVALEAETWFADGRLDAGEPVRLSAANRTFGPTGISLFDDDAVVSWRDLVVLMLTISDNHATDTLLRRVGIDAVNATAARLGLAARSSRPTCRPCSTASARTSAVPAGRTRSPGQPPRAGRTGAGRSAAAYLPGLGPGAGNPHHRSRPGPAAPVIWTGQAGWLRLRTSANPDGPAAHQAPDRQRLPTRRRSRPRAAASSVSSATRSA